ncbi:hypothetical protein K505DRAFT_336802 [Melanomma pulvis-pyrius CBS 109.77]|uniref:NACHT domain-containing protein n=1 Tax=Melanomma pulvis-pyrius CBS 109.77 TaxID=1314802 RepID=A0A6A6XDR6_9PLEO|nr:hypothetical protein K505DRAFT_336802 [Melanomma pulvis-pyrius CBS 109.77]
MYWKQLENETEPTYMEMKKVFESVMKRSSGFLKLCIFIDGIDEYDGDDHRDLCLFLRSLISANLKIIVSSRPIPACISIFEDCPSLRLQDLTRRDMDVFVRGELSPHRLMVGMQRHFPEQCRDIIANIKDKAEGVFLWVKLVVRELIEGLEAGDDINELQDRMRSLPSDLKDLYRRMIGKMKQEYQVQAAEIFQSFHRWNTSTGDEPLKALVLSLATHLPSAAFNAPTAPFDCQGVVWLAQHIETRTNDSVVAYLHRTVTEFLTTIDVWEEICSITKDSGFDPMQKFASAYLSLTKAADGFGDSSLPSFITNTVGFCRMSTDISDDTFTKYVSAIDDTVTQLQHGAKNEWGLSFSKDAHWSVELFNYISTMHEPFESPGILIFATHNALVRYLKAVIRLRDISASTRVAIALMRWRPGKTLIVHPYQLRADGKFFDFAELLKIFANTVPCAQKYMSTSAHNEKSGEMQIATLIGPLLDFEDEDIRTLGSEFQYSTRKDSAACDTYGLPPSLG